MNLFFYPYLLQLKHQFTVSTYSRNTTPGVQVEICHEGVTGYGEASMPPYLGETIESVTAFLNKVDLKQFTDPTRMDEILDYVEGIAPDNCAAKAAVDIALHDLVGKMEGKPLHVLWRLDRKKMIDTFYTIGIDTPEKMIEKTCEVAGQFNILKVKLGTERDEEIVRAIRSVTSLPIAVDANQGWTDKKKALDMIHYLNEQGCILVEQPMDRNSLDEIAWITQHSPLPIIADESVKRLQDVDRIKGAFSGINIKLMKCTGLREAGKMVQLARSLDMKVMLGCMTETSCAISAAAQLAPVADYADLDGNLLITNDLFEGAKIEGGKIVLNDLPGIGIVKL